MLEVKGLHSSSNVEPKRLILAFIDNIKKSSDNVLDNSKYSKEVLALINKYWWKTASIVWQYVNWNSKYLLPFDILDVKNRDSIDIQEDKEQDEFLRASASWDECGLVWMLKSLRTWKYWKYFDGEDIEDYRTAKDIISKIINHWDSDLIRLYAEWYDWNKDYHWIDSILVSPNIEEEFYDSTFGSITKHPDFEDIYIINIDWWRAQCLVDSKWKIYKIIWFYDRLDIVKVNLQEIIQMKLETDNAWFVDWMTTQTEFAIISDKQKDRINKLSNNYEFSIKLDSNIAFLQQREFRKESKEKVNQDTLEEWGWSLYNYNMFWDQSVFKKWYRKINLLDLVESSPKIDDLPEYKKIILEVTTANYRLLKSNPNSFGILKNPRIVGVIINKVQSDWLWSIEHDTYRIINNELPIKVVEL